MSGNVALRNEGRLSAEREQRLQELPGWTWDKHTTQWEEGFSRLLEYVRQNRSARNIALTSIIGDFKLGTWVNVQRTNRTKGKLEVDRERRLQEVPGWTWNAIESQWDEALTYLRAHIKQYGNARIPRPYLTEDGFKLGQWVHNRRRDYARGSLETNRAQQLETLPGWTWDPHADQWEDAFSQLLKYVEETGTSRVPKPKRGANALELWAQRQRASRAKGELDADRERRLQELPGWTWHSLADRWEEGFAQLQRYVEETGNARVLQSISFSGYPLGTWVTKQRAKRRQGSLESDRVERLERLPGWSWDPVADLWEEGHRRLAEFVQLNGHARVPNAYAVNGYELGNWVNIQRGLHLRKGKLDPERARRLQELPGWTWDARADWWEEGYRRLQDFVESKGDASVPSSCTIDGYRLGSWVNSQRGRYAKGTLDTDRQRRLQALPGWQWNTLDEQWQEGFRQLQRFVERNGHARVSHSFSHEGYRLGSWVAKQRAKHAKGVLDLNRQRRLQDQPGWTWDGRASDKWEEGYRLLLRYVEQHGDARVVRSYAIDGFQLGTWVELQRRTHTVGALRPTGRTDCRICLAGYGTPSPLSGRRALAEFLITSSSMVTPASLSPTRLMDTRSVRGQVANAKSTPKAPSTPTADAGSKICLGGHGILSRRSGRRASSGWWSIWIAMAMFACLRSTKSTAIG